MASLFIVEDDSHFRSVLTRDLEGHGFQVASASSVHSALAALARHPADVVLTDLWLGGPDGLDLLKMLPRVSRRTRPILMSANASARDHQVATELGAIDILIKPFTQTELLRSIHKAIDCETGFQGSVHGLSLIDMAQMFHLSQRSVTLVVTTAGLPPSKIHFRRGEIVDASHGALDGCDALRALLATSSGTLQTTGLEDGIVQSIDAPFDHLLLASLSRLDEELHDGRAPGDMPALFDVGDDGELVAPPARGGLDLAALLDLPPAAARDGAIEAACRRVVEAVDGALACAVVGVEHGVLLGYHQRSGGAPLSEDACAAAGRELFGGAGRLAVGRLHEVQLTATDHHLFGKLLADRERALILVTDRTISVGLGWALLRSQIGLVERPTP
ncbi:response regulator [Nannocystis radixulma]|uniref:Response regulator n=1 Tax=Nannocystis radixulma TaxID=2995305 RepID=A0ABT5BKS1_9BACT|nr:response regulator [Nannocystis radixulma]MDC0674747.1 response regulator [Nannocystis radixulma]